MRSSNDDITTLNWEGTFCKFSLFPILRNRSQPNALLFANGINETFFTIFQQDTEVKIRCSLGLTGKQATANCDANAMNNHFVVKKTLISCFLPSCDHYEHKRAPLSRPSAFIPKRVGIPSYLTPFRYCRSIRYHPTIRTQTSDYSETIL